MVSEQDEYTPSVEEAREAYVVGGEPEVAARWRAEFDRMIEQVRREAAAEQREKDARMARDVADALANSGLIEHGDGAYDAAAAIREAGKNG